MSLTRLSLRRQRQLGEIISDSFSLYFRSWRQLGAVVAPSVLVSIALSLVAFAVADSNTANSLVVVASLPVELVAYQLVSAAAIAYINEQDSGHAISAGDALDMAQERAAPVIGASLRSTAVVFLMACTLVGIPWAIKRLIRWAFIIQSIMLDGQSGDDALAYSASIVLGRWWRTAGRLFVSGLVIGLPSLLVSSIIVAALPGVAGILISGATGFFVYPYGIIATTLIFFHLKTRRPANDKLGPA